MTEFKITKLEPKVSETERMVDTQPKDVYEQLQTVAAVDYVNTRDWDGSAEALALRQAFDLGSNTALQFDQMPVRLIQAVMAGRRWGLKRKSTRRLVAIGKKVAAFSTLDIRIDNSTASKAAAAGLPQWSPGASPAAAEFLDMLTESEPDHDLQRKQEIEDELARGDDA
jgi:hypothetical protein